MVGRSGDVAEGRPQGPSSSCIIGLLALDRFDLPSMLVILPDIYNAIHTVRPARIHESVYHHWPHYCCCKRGVVLSSPCFHHPICFWVGTVLDFGFVMSCRWGIGLGSKGNNSSPISLWRVRAEPSFLHSQAHGRCWTFGCNHHRLVEGSTRDFENHKFKKSVRTELESRERVLYHLLSMMQEPTSTVQSFWPWRIVLWSSQESFDVSRAISESYFTQSRSLSSVLTSMMTRLCFADWQGPMPRRAAKYETRSVGSPHNWFQLEKWGLEAHFTGRQEMLRWGFS